MTRVVVIGGGGREHALVRALRRGVGAREIVQVPGNPGIAREARCVPALPSLADAALAESPDLVVVGPEAPLAEGFADRMAQRGVPCFGPVQAAARIESSKAFAKGVMLAAGVPTPKAAVFVDPAAARDYARSQGPSVIKLDGLAAGKGVIVADDGAAAAAAVDELWKPGATLLVEERLAGREVSIIALCDGEMVLPLPPARDHKRLLDGDRGPNTGGMGAVCPPSDVTQELVAVVLAAHGYPGAPRAMDPIHGLEALAAEEGEDLWILHAGTKSQAGTVVTAGGRVLTVAALGSGPAQARARAYGAAARISFAGSQIRSDIATAEL